VIAATINDVRHARWKDQRARTVSSRTQRSALDHRAPASRVPRSVPSTAIGATNAVVARVGRSLTWRSRGALTGRPLRATQEVSISEGALMKRGRQQSQRAEQRDRSSDNGLSAGG